MRQPASRSYETEQEKFWAGSFGDEYSARNRGAGHVASYTAMWARILGRTHGVSSILELGCNIGLNLRAFRQLLPEASLTAVEINATAAAEAARVPADVKVGSILEYEPDRRHDLVVIAGVLMHIEPTRLPTVYDLMHRASGRYICLAEYYNPTPVEIPYRGHRERLYKRDYAGELLDRFDDLSLVDYGFVYRRDPTFPQDDTTWFLLERHASTTSV
jgi:spore coat polysaccharide biosynthesis protein SpsF